MVDTIRIHGYSDDLIAIEGEITDEIPANYNEPTTVKIGPWEFRVEYDGEWHIEVVESATGQSYKKWLAGHHPDSRDYSELVEISGHPEYEVRAE